jgi:transcriptional regulator with XRE-family HTH domain
MHSDDRELTGKPRQTAIALGRELRRQREVRGLTQAQTARAVGLSARSAVADYESGRRIPPDDILANYERTFAVAPGTLTRHRDRLNAEQAEEHYAAALASPAAAATSGMDAEPPRAPATAEARSAPSRARRVVIRAAALAVLCLVLAGSAAASGSSPSSVDPTWTALTQNVTNHAIPGASPEQMDGDDPRARDCYADAVTVQQVPFNLPDDKPFGTLRLRHSPRCGASWGSAYYSNPQLYTIRITVHRPWDDAIIRNDWSNNTRPGSYSDMLSTGPGCVWVEVVVITPAGTSTPAHSGCSS